VSSDEEDQCNVTPEEDEKYDDFFDKNVQQTRQHMQVSEQAMNTVQMSVERTQLVKDLVH